MIGVSIVAPSLSTNSGGFGLAILGMCNAIRQYHPKFDFSLHALTPPSICDITSFEHSIIGTATLGFSPSLIKPVVSSECEIVQTHGMWMATPVAPLFSSLMKSKKTVLSPYGIMDLGFWGSHVLKKYWRYTFQVNLKVFVYFRFYIGPFGVS